MWPSRRACTTPVWHGQSRLKGTHPINPWGPTTSRRRSERRRGRLPGLSGGTFGSLKGVPEHAWVDGGAVWVAGGPCVGDWLGAEGGATGPGQGTGDRRGVATLRAVVVRKSAEDVTANHLRLLGAAAWTSRWPEACWVGSAARTVLLLELLESRRWADSGRRRTGRSCRSVQRSFSPSANPRSRPSTGWASLRVFSTCVTRARLTRYRLAISALLSTTPSSSRRWNSRARSVALQAPERER